MDDILIIVLTLLFTIFAAISQSKKKKAGQEKKELLPWDEIFRDRSQVPEPVEEMTVNHGAYQPKPVIKRIKFPEITESDFMREGIRNESIKIKAEQKNNEFFKEEEAESYLDGFSLKKAVIYSEILRPKYLE